MLETVDLLQPMRISQLIRLLNSTPLGPVIAPHRMYRHHALAGGQIEEAGRVSLARCTAWLRVMRAEGKTLVGCRPRARKTIGHDGSVNKRSVLALVQWQNHRCALSGRVLTPQVATLDHIVPVSRGGDHRIGNAQVLDRAVNRAKGTLTNEEFISLCGDVWRFTQMRKRLESARNRGSDRDIDGQRSLFSTED